MVFELAGQLCTINPIANVHTGDQYRRMVALYFGRDQFYEKAARIQALLVRAQAAGLGLGLGDGAGGLHGEGEYK